MELKPHPLAELFPKMPDDEFSQLVADIKRGGLLEPIWIYEGKVLDGWHRYRAALEAGKEPRPREWKGDDPLAFVISMNVLRRHLNKSQRSLLLVMAAEKEKRLAKRGGDRDFESAETADSKELTDASIAAMVGVGERTVSQARRVAREEPSLAKKVLAGTVGLDEADEIIRRKERKAAGKPPVETPRRTKLPPELSEAIAAIVATVRLCRKVVKSARIGPEDIPFIISKVDEIVAMLTDFRHWLKEQAR